MDGTALFWAVVFGGAGIGYFSYGRKQRALIPLVTGIALFIFPYFINNIYALVFTGVVLISIPYFIRL